MVTAKRSQREVLLFICPNPFAGTIGLGPTPGPTTALHSDLILQDRAQSLLTKPCKVGEYYSPHIADGRLRLKKHDLLKATE